MQSLDFYIIVILKHNILLDIQFKTKKFFYSLIPHSVLKHKLVNSFFC